MDKELFVKWARSVGLGEDVGLPLWQALSKLPAEVSCDILRRGEKQSIQWMVMQVAENGGETAQVLRSFAQTKKRRLPSRPSIYLYILLIISLATIIWRLFPRTFNMGEAEITYFCVHGGGTVEIIALSNQTPTTEVSSMVYNVSLFKNPSSGHFRLENIEADQVILSGSRPDNCDDCSGYEGPLSVGKWKVQGKMVSFLLFTTKYQGRPTRVIVHDTFLGAIFRSLGNIGVYVVIYLLVLFVEKKFLSKRFK